MADPDDRTDTWTDSVSMRLACLALVAWAPGAVGQAASSSALLQLVPVPGPALQQARELGGWVAGQLDVRA